MQKNCNGINELLVYLYTYILMKILALSRLTIRSTYKKAAKYLEDSQHSCREVAEMGLRAAVLEVEPLRVNRVEFSNCNLGR